MSENADQVVNQDQDLAPIDDLHQAEAPGADQTITDDLDKKMQQHQGIDQADQEDQVQTGNTQIEVPNHSDWYSSSDDDFGQGLELEMTKVFISPSTTIQMVWFSTFTTSSPAPKQKRETGTGQHRFQSGTSLPHQLPLGALLGIFSHYEAAWKPPAMATAGSINAPIRLPEVTNFVVVEAPTVLAELSYKYDLHLPGRQRRCSHRRRWGRWPASCCSPASRPKSRGGSSSMNRSRTRLAGQVRRRVVLLVARRDSPCPEIPPSPLDTPYNPIDRPQYRMTFDIKYENDGRRYLAGSGPTFVKPLARDALYGTKYMTTLVQDQKSNPQGEWVMMEILIRGSSMYDGQQFLSTTSSTKSKPNIWQKLAFLEAGTPSTPANTIPPECYIVGLSMLDLEPAVLTPPRSNQNTGSEQYAQDSFDGPPIRGGVISGRILGRSVIPFHDMTVSGNLVAFKNATKKMNAGRGPADSSVPSAADPQNRVGNGRPAVRSHAVETAFKNGEYQFGSALIKKTQRFLSEIATGVRPSPVVRIKAQAKPAAPITGSTANAALKVSSVNLVTAVIDSKRLGFQLQLAPVMVLEFAPGLLQQLDLFLQAHPHDLISMATALQACCLWADINAHDKRFMENALSSEKKVPNPSLGQVIIYFPVVLAFTEFYTLVDYCQGTWLARRSWLLARHAFLTCDNYPHLFRFVDHAVSNDTNTYAGFRVNETALNESEVLRYVNEAQSRVADFKATDRLSVWPSNIPGSRMPLPKEVQQRTTAEMAVLGIGAISQYGLQHFREPWSIKATTTLVALPKDIATDVYMRQNCTVFHGPVPDGFWYTQSKDIKSFLGPIKTSASIWEYVHLGENVCLESSALPVESHPSASPPGPLSAPRSLAMELPPLSAQHRDNFLKSLNEMSEMGLLISPPNGCQLSNDAGSKGRLSGDLSSMVSPLPIAPDEIVTQDIAEGLLSRIGEHEGVPHAGVRNIFNTLIAVADGERGSLTVEALATQIRDSLCEAVLDIQIASNCLDATMAVQGICFLPGMMGPNGPALLPSLLARCHGIEACFVEGSNDPWPMDLRSRLRAHDKRALDTIVSIFTGVQNHQGIAVIELQLLALCHRFLRESFAPEIILPLKEFVCGVDGMTQSMAAFEQTFVEVQARVEGFGP
ncbi:hypothetical protein NLG97_g7764 [Lecanicillium saksenae]|uniref:Uncharacterized protein n=1 Tax=Lecanicillium saksenae TaxID=468837 RepID=A0ACC1QM59_9HYPO|nr:hypothetical protein NLG97_g7764 [Lecanicillium saksenae]